MEFNFSIKNDKLTSLAYPNGVTGNVNTYTCRFNIECDIAGLIWFCIFKQGSNIYNQIIEDNTCIIPYEVLTSAEPLYIGCYGTNASDDIKRVSTNFVCFDVKQGAYSESDAPKTPTPDVWESLINKNVPYIGDNGNWFIYDVEQKKYVDSGTASQGEKGEQGIQGEKGDKGEQGIQGERGEKGDSYVLTSADKSEIADLVNITSEGIENALGYVPADKSDLVELSNTVVNESDEFVPVEIKPQSDGYYNLNGVFVTNETTRLYAIVEPVSSGDTFRVSTYLSSAIIPAILYFNENTFISYEKLGTGSAETVIDYEFTIPSNCTKLIVESASKNRPISLSKKQHVLKSKSYTKEESDFKFDTKKEYGVKWSVTDNDDLGQRCFSAEGLSAIIGRGTSDGHSDFDNIYPWSEIKRCNIKTNANGANIVTYEGETGFALDGSNGDVFVRIPKFTIERYIKDGYEYRVIGNPNALVHEAFIENGKVLDEIFIGAFEGYVGADDKLHSIADVIPTNNEIPETFLTKANNNGNNYSLYDMRCVDAIWSLMAVEFGCRNTNRIIGYGLSDFMQANETVAKLQVVEDATNTNNVKVGALTDSYKVCMPVGSNITICDHTQDTIIAQRKIISIVDTDDSQNTIVTFDGEGIDVTTSCFIGSAPLETNFCESCSSPLSWHTGRANFINNSTTQNPVRYRWIENVVGNVWHFLPDITFNNLQMYVCKNMQSYQFHNYKGNYKAVGDTLIENTSNGSKADSVGVNFWVDSLLNDTFAKSVTFGKSYNKDLTSTKAFGGYYYLKTGVMCIANGGGFDHLYRCNMLTQRAWIESTKKWFLYGARLMFKKLD